MLLLRSRLWCPTLSPPLSKKTFLSFLSSCLIVHSKLCLSNDPLSLPISHAYVVYRTYLAICTTHTHCFARFPLVLTNHPPQKVYAYVYCRCMMMMMHDDSEWIIPGIREEEPAKVAACIAHTCLPAAHTYFPTPLFCNLVTPEIVARNGWVVTLTHSWVLLPHEDGIVGFLGNGSTILT